MLSININQDVEQYRETVAAGMDAKQTLTVIGATAVGAVQMLLFYGILHLPAILSVYLSIPLVIPVIMKGFGNKDGLTVKERLQYVLKKDYRPLGYVSLEGKIHGNIEKEDQPQNSTEEFERFLRRTKRMLVAVAVGIVLLIFGCVAWKLWM